jgi:hypothetical protein
MTAKVDGVDWAPTIQASGAHVVPGSYILTGLSTASGGSSMTFSLSNIGDTGTYALGMGPSGFGGTVQWVKGSAGWVTPLSGVAGTIHITALSDTHMTGTFAFTADHLTGGATGTVHVTGGTFDAPVTTSGNPGPLPDRSGSRITADVDGAVFNAATTAVTLPNDTTLVVAATSLSSGVGINLYGLHGAGQYDVSLSPLRTLTYSTFDGTNFNLWGGVAGDSGSIHITSVTAGRIEGSYTLRLAPSTGPGATSPIHVSGDFSLGRP